MSRFVNPYFCYAFAFTVAFGLYSLAWSDLYPPITTALIAFVACTVGIHLVFGIIFSRKKYVSFSNITVRSVRAPLLVTIFIYALWLVEFFHAGGIPLIKILLNQPYDYRAFGVPTLHVFVVTFSSFYTVFLFHLFLSNRSLALFVLYGINLAAALLIYNRGMLLFNISSTVFLYLTTKNKLLIKHAIITFIGIVCVFFIFGLLGSLRTSHEGNAPYSNDDILNTAQASSSFKNSFIPYEFFWSYFYMSSPLANYQLNLTSYQPPPFTVAGVLEWGNNEVLPDFISKRINLHAGKERKVENRIMSVFNASTIYAGSFIYLGWTGVILMSMLILVVPFIITKCISNASPFFLTTISIVNSLFLFMIFDNTLRFSGLSFQLVYPILLNFILLRFPRLWEIFA